MNFKMLQQAYNDYFKVAHYQGLRFGQYVYNEYGYEVGNTYNIENTDECYSVLFNSLTVRLDEALEV